MLTIAILEDLLRDAGFVLTKKGYYLAFGAEIIIDFGVYFARLYIITAPDGQQIVARFQQNDYIIGRFAVNDPECFDKLLESLRRVGGAITDIGREPKGLTSTI